MIPWIVVSYQLSHLLSNIVLENSQQAKNRIRRTGLTILIVLKGITQHLATVCTVKTRGMSEMRGLDKVCVVYLGPNLLNLCFL